MRKRVVVRVRGRVAGGGSRGHRCGRRVAPLFDGNRSTAGTVPGGKWKVKDGVIVGTSPQTERLHGMLLSDKQYGDFVLRLKFKSLKGNSGLYFRAERVN